MIMCAVWLEGPRTYFNFQFTAWISTVAKKPWEHLFENRQTIDFSGEEQLTALLRLQTKLQDLSFPVQRHIPNRNQEYANTDHAAKGQARAEYDVIQFRSLNSAVIWMGPKSVELFASLVLPEFCYNSFAARRFWKKYSPWVQKFITATTLIFVISEIVEDVVATSADGGAEDAEANPDSRLGPSIVRFWKDMCLEHDLVVGILMWVYEFFKLSVVAGSVWKLINVSDGFGRVFGYTKTVGTLCQNMHGGATTAYEWCAGIPGKMQQAKRFAATVQQGLFPASNRSGTTNETGKEKVM
jgi:hypothetical protein